MIKYKEIRKGIKEIKIKNYKDKSFTELIKSILNPPKLNSWVKRNEEKKKIS